MTNVLPLNHQLSHTHTYRAAATQGNYQHLPGTRQPIKMFHYLQFKELLEAKHPPTSSLTRTSIPVSPDQKHLLDVCFTSTVKTSQSQKVKAELHFVTCQKTETRETLTSRQELSGLLTFNTKTNITFTFTYFQIKY